MMINNDKFWFPLNNAQGLFPSQRSGITPGRARGPDAVAEVESSQSCARQYLYLNIISQPDFIFNLSQNCLTLN